MVLTYSLPVYVTSDAQNAWCVTPECTHFTNARLERRRESLTAALALIAFTANIETPVGSWSPMCRTSVGRSWRASSTAKAYFSVTESNPPDDITVVP